MLELKISIGARAKIKEKLDSMLSVNSFNTTSTSQSQSSQSQSSLLNEFSNLNLDDNCHNTEYATEDEDEDDFDAVELEDEDSFI